MQRTSRDEATPAVGLFGKLPCAADFVRIHHDHAGAIALDEWLTKSVQALAQARVRWPREVLRFVLDLGECGQVLTGLVAPSRDRAGRSYPVAIYAALPTGQLVGRLAELCVLSSPFLAAAEELLEEAAGLDRTALERALGMLPAPRVDGLGDAAAGLREILEARSGGEFADSAFGAGCREHAKAALDSLVRAAGDVAHSPPRRANVMSLTARTVADLWTFVALAQRSLRWRDRVPSVLWGADPDGMRTLLSLGKPTCALPLWWTDPRRGDGRVMRLDTAGCIGEELASPPTGREWDLVSSRAALEALLHRRRQS